MSAPADPVDHGTLSADDAALFDRPPPAPPAGLPAGPELTAEGEEVFDFDRISEDEDAERERERLELGAGADLDSFWQRAPEDEDAPELEDGLGGGAPDDRPGDDFVDGRLHEVLATKADAAVAADRLPERLKELEIEASRQAGAADGPAPEVSLNRAQEALWIVQRLLNPGHALAGSDLAADPRPERAARVARAVEVVLSLVRDHHLEPSHVFLYHQTSLSPLLEELWAIPGVRAAWGDSLADPSLAYSAVTGLRQLPAVDDIGGRRIIGFRSETRRSTAVPLGDRDTAWGHADSARVVRRPGAVEAGRLVWEILELDSQCHSLERQRLMAVARLEDVVESNPRLTRQLVHLRGTLYEVPLDKDAWTRFATFMWKRFGSGHEEYGDKVKDTPTAMLLRRGYHNALEEFGPWPHEFQQHLLGEPMPPARPKTETPVRWAERHVAAVGQEVTPARCDNLLRRCSQAVTEQLVVLPVLSRRVYDAFCRRGRCVATPTEAGRPTLEFPVSALLADAPHIFLELLDAVEDRKLRINLELPPDDLAAAMGLEAYVAAATNTGGDPELELLWGVPFRDVVRDVKCRVVHQVLPAVHAALCRAAEQHAIQRATTTLGRLCAEGPYQPTRLAIDSWRPQQATWDSSWEAVEALPRDAEAARDPAVVGHARVLAAYRDERHVTCWAAVDEHGAMQGFVLWVDTARDTEEGRAHHEQQVADLLRLCERCLPDVIAVGTSGPMAIGTFGDAKRFADEVLAAKLGVSVPVVYASVVVARVAVEAVCTLRELPGSHPTLRIAAALAQHVQHPCFSICRLFDTKRSAMLLPLGSAALGRGGVSRSRLYRWLNWEVSLWVAAAGVDLNAKMFSSSPEAVLQFVPGLGPRRAAAFVEYLQRATGGTAYTIQELRAAFTATCGDGAEAALRNGAATLRLTPPVREEDAGGYDLVDATLIPREWRRAVDRLVAWAVDRDPATAVAALLVEGPTRRYEMLRGVESGGPAAFEAMMRDMAADGYPFEFGPRELQFIMDELVAFGEVTAFRGFRHISSQRFFRLMAGVPYVPRTRPADSTVGAAIFQDDVIEGTVESLTIRDQAGGSCLRLRTSRGVAAVMFEDDITNEVVRGAFRDAVVARARQKELRRQALEGGLPPPPPPPELHPALRKGAHACGTVLGANYASCELRLQWADPPPPVALLRAEAADRHAVAAAETATLQSDVSLTTARLEKAATSTMLEGTRHPLFRDWSKRRIEESLSQPAVGLGEMLFHRADRREGGADFCAVVKVGDSALVGIGIAERRGDRQSRFDYVVQNHRFKQEHPAVFSSLDHFRAGYVDPLLRRVTALRADSHFHASQADARQALQHAVRQDPKHLAYAITEVPPLAGGKTSCPYIIYYCGGDASRLFRARIAVAADGLWLYTGCRHHGGYECCGDVPALHRRFRSLVVERARSTSRSAARGPGGSRSAVAVN